MSTPTREQRAASAIRSLVKDADEATAIATVLNALYIGGVSSREVAKAAINRVGGVMGSKDVCDYISSHGIEVASTNLKRVAPGLEPFDWTASTPLYFGNDALPHKQRLWRYRENQRLRAEERAASEAGDLVAVPVPYKESGQS